MTTATLDLCDGLVAAAAPALGSHARVIVRTNSVEPGPGCDPALAVLGDVNRSCSRFDPESEIRTLNADPTKWHVVSKTCLTAVREAWWAYRRTSGEFDPRLEVGPRQPRQPWQPAVDEASSRVHIGGVPLDLDGIARGLALRWAGRALGGTQHFITVGDAAWGSGRGPDGAPWQVGLDDPLGDPSPLAVLSVSDSACTTTSATRARIAGQRVESGLVSVTVVGPDAVAAEVWSTVLLATRHVAEVVSRRRLPAAWVTDDGVLHTSPALEPKVRWRR